MIGETNRLKCLLFQARHAELVIKICSNERIKRISLTTDNSKTDKRFSLITSQTYFQK